VNPNASSFESQRDANALSDSLTSSMRTLSVGKIASDLASIIWRVPVAKCAGTVTFPIARRFQALAHRPLIPTHKLAEQFFALRRSDSVMRRGADFIILVRSSNFGSARSGFVVMR
jgi:hypothetical protein